MVDAEKAAANPAAKKLIAKEMREVKNKQDKRSQGLGEGMLRIMLPRRGRMMLPLKL